MRHLHVVVALATSILLLLGAHGFVLTTNKTILAQARWPAIYFPPLPSSSASASSTRPLDSLPGAATANSRGTERRRRLFDTFGYNGEETLLLWRVKLLAPFVDVFVVVESDRTYTGGPKPLTFSESTRQAMLAAGAKQVCFSIFLCLVSHLVGQQLIGGSWPKRTRSGNASLSLRSWRTPMLRS